MHGPRWAGFCAVLLLGLLIALAPPAHGQDLNSRPVLLLDVTGVIGFVAVGELTKALERAKAEEAALLIIRLDTPGGLLSSTRDMIREVLASTTPIVVYVAPNGARAASAGTYLVYASHLAAMAPGTHLGAATPVSLGVPGLPGSPPPQPSPGAEKKPAAPDTGTAEERKAVNDAAAYLRSLAEIRKRDADFAEKAVREAATLTASEAMKKGVVEVIAGNVDELLAAIDGRSVATAAGDITLRTKGNRIVELKPDWKAQLMSTITDPNIAFILLLIGIYGILFEFMSPGVVAPGVIGGICLIVALTALTVLPLSYGGLALLLFGIALMAAEAFVPSFGILGLGGIIAFVLGALFLFDPAEAQFGFGVAWPLIVGAAATSAAFVIGVAGFALKARRRAVRTGAEEMIGSTGEVLNWIGGQGQVRVHGEIWAARSDQSLASGRKVRVVGRTGLTLVVEQAA
jgi:membrane-bound serine protease (ClpP class)